MTGQILASLLVGLIALHPSTAQYRPSDSEMAAAVLPLPVDMRAEAGVIHWDVRNGIQMYKRSSNGIACMLDNPDDEIYDVRCYDEQFWGVISRARQIGSETDTRAERDSVLNIEIEKGLLPLPKSPTAGYRILDRNSAYYGNSVALSDNASKWQSIHFPFRTAAELGLTESEELNREKLMPGIMPYVMWSGTWWSHVMIVHRLDWGE